MTDNRQKLSARLAEGLRAAFERKPAFCNIADGTHAGSITMVAEESVDNAYLVVKAGANDGGFAVAGAADKPFGVCSDEGAKGERLAVILPASAESTIMCRAATDIPAGASVYTSANGKVSAAALLVFCALLSKTSPTLPQAASKATASTAAVNCIIFFIRSPQNGNLRTAKSRAKIAF